MAGKTVLETKASSDARSGSGETAATIVRGTAPADDADVEQRLTSVAEMAEAQAKVAALLAELHAVRDAAAFDADAVETQISALLPRPTVIVPLPPANRDAVQQAIEIAERIRARSEEHTSELQSLMRISYAVFCLKKK